MKSPVPDKLTIFLSCVSDEFQHYRGYMSEHLNTIKDTKLKIVSQQNLSEEPYETLQMLSKNILKCDAVIHLVGQCGGSTPANKDSVAKFISENVRQGSTLARYDDQQLLDCTYTQWEAILAIRHDKPLFIAELSPCEQEPEQVLHIKRLKENDRFPLPSLRFQSKEELVSKLRDSDFELIDKLKILLDRPISSLAEYENSVSKGFSSFLLGENLPFLYPADTVKWSPKRLFKLLASEHEKYGVLLSGVGGVGKSRATLETAHIAASYGWKVFYFSRINESYENKNNFFDQLFDVLRHLPADSQILVCIEYIETLSNVNFESLKRRLIKERAEYGRTLKILANCRSGYLIYDNNKTKASSVFHVVDMVHDDEFRSKLLVHVIEHVAPQAFSRFGERLIEACGSRTIIALFIAKQIERLIEESRHASQDLLASANTADLTYWLHKRLTEDGLLPVQESEHEPPIKSDTMRQAIVFMACTPITSEDLMHAIDPQRVESRESQKQRFFLSRLVAYGWIDNEAGVLQLPHDVVFDELFRAVTVSGDYVDHEAPRDMISFFSGGPQFLSNICSNIDRAYKTFHPDLQVQLEEKLKRNLESKAKHISQTLLESDPDKAGYALGALLRSKALSGPTSQVWKQLVSPWLERYGDYYEARHIIFTGLKHAPLSDEQRKKLTRRGLTWIQEWGESSQASLVLSGLIESEVNSDGNLHTIFLETITWLQSHITEQNARFLLATLISNYSHDVVDLSEVSRLTNQWLDKYASHRFAALVINSLWSERQDDSEQESTRQELFEKLDDFTFLWLNHWVGEPHAFSLLYSLCLTVPQSAPNHEELLALIDRWLSLQVTTTSFSTQLRTLLSVNNVPTSVRHKVLEESCRRLTACTDDQIKSHLAPTIIWSLRRNTDENLIETCSVEVVDWLKSSPLTVESSFTLKALLIRGNMVSINRSNEILSVVYAWLEKFGRDNEASFVLRSLFKSRIPQKEDIKCFLNVAKKWIESNAYDHEGQAYLFEALIYRVGVLEINEQHQFYDLGVNILSYELSRNQKEKLLTGVLRSLRTCILDDFPDGVKSMLLSDSALIQLDEDSSITADNIWWWILQNGKSYANEGEVERDLAEKVNRCIRSIENESVPEYVIGYLFDNKNINKNIDRLEGSIVVWLARYPFSESSARLVRGLISYSPRILERAGFQNAVSQYLSTQGVGELSTQVLHEIFFQSKHMNLTVDHEIIDIAIDWVSKGEIIECDSIKFLLQSIPDYCTRVYGQSESVLLDAWLQICTNWLALNRQHEAFPTIYHRFNKVLLPDAGGSQSVLGNGDGNVRRLLYLGLLWIRVQSSAQKQDDRFVLVPLVTFSRELSKSKILVFERVDAWIDAFGDGDSAYQLLHESVKRFEYLDAWDQRMDPIFRKLIRRSCAWIKTYSEDGKSGYLVKRLIKISKEDVGEDFKKDFEISLINWFNYHLPNTYAVEYLREAKDASVFYDLSISLNVIADEFIEKRNKTGLSEEDQRFVNTYFDLIRTEPSQSLFDFCEKWLEQFKESQYARFMLSPLLYNVTNSTNLNVIKAYAHLWLQKHAKQSYSSIVERALAARDE